MIPCFRNTLNFYEAKLFIEPSTCKQSLETEEYNKIHFLKTQHNTTCDSFRKEGDIKCVTKATNILSWQHNSHMYTPTNQCYKRTPLNTQKQQVKDIKEKENTDYRERYSSGTRT